MENNNSKSITKSIFVFVVSALIILGGISTAWYMISTAPVAKKRPPAPLSALVRVQPLELKDSVVKISAMGTTLPVEGLYLKPKITGIVQGFGDNYGSGCVVKKGEPLIYIENIDQRATYDLAQAVLIQSQANLDIEIGSQAVAKRELELLQNSNIGAKIEFENQADADLALRKPQLKIAQAAVDIAKANVETAKNDFEYTLLKAPFNAFIDNNVTTLGMHASPTTTLCDVYGTDSFWVDATVTYETLKFLEIPNWSTDEKKGSLAKIHLKGTDGLVGSRVGDVRRMRSLLRDGDNMVRLMILLEDPLCLNEENKGKEKILLHATVDVEIHGKELKNVYEIPRSAWREDKEIWIVDENKKLKKMTPKLIWRTKNSVFIDPEGIPNGTQIITSTLSLSVDGLALNIIEEEKSDNE